MGVGMPASIWLQEFGSLVWAAFGDPPYHVGSSLANKDGWRDVDVRMMLSREEWDRWGFGDPKRPHDSEKWQAVCLAFSALGKQMTGLPIDFQVQEVETANAENPKGGRSALGITPRRRYQPPCCETCGSKYHWTHQHDGAVENFQAALVRARAARADDSTKTGEARPVSPDADETVAATAADAAREPEGTPEGPAAT